MALSLDRPPNMRALQKAQENAFDPLFGGLDGLDRVESELEKRRRLLTVGGQKNCRELYRTTRSTADKCEGCARRAKTLEMCLRRERAATTAEHSEVFDQYEGYCFLKHFENITKDGNPSSGHVSDSCAKEEAEDRRVSRDVLLSCIIPVRNAAQFIGAALRGLALQSVLFVDAELLRKETTMAQHTRCCGSIGGEEETGEQQTEHRRVGGGRWTECDVDDGRCCRCAGMFELCIFDDNSTDDSLEMIRRWLPLMEYCGWRVVVTTTPVNVNTTFDITLHNRSQPESDAIAHRQQKQQPLSVLMKGSGPGNSRNCAVWSSAGCYLAFHDADDVSAPDRLLAQVCAQLALLYGVQSDGGYSKQQGSMQCTGMTGNTIVGTCFDRSPSAATPRYVQWLNSLTGNQLVTSRFRECTVAMPTWWMSRALYDDVGGFAEGVGVAEDLIFLYHHIKKNQKRNSQEGNTHDMLSRPAIRTCRQHAQLFMTKFLQSAVDMRWLREQLPADISTVGQSIDIGQSRKGDVVCTEREPSELLSASTDGLVARVNLSLLTYRYHPGCLTFGVDKDYIWSLRMREFVTSVLVNWKQFGIWNAGKAGRKFYRDLPTEQRKKVSCFYDVDVRKVHQTKFVVDGQVPHRKMPILHWSELLRVRREQQVEMVVTCVKYNLDGKGTFEEYVRQTGMIEGVHFYHFC
eukprot:GHVS01091228.1.p1 GENE.GHVS01091228.1~~GHVS01091228.1.p1  ORF type:complete len:688 (-),score=113.64 GHVS01091228.1:103-2166(-)